MASGNVLIVEDSEFYGKLLKRRITIDLNIQVIWCKTLAETREVLTDLSDFSIALLDYHLPDAMEGEIIDLCNSYSIPSIVMTGSYSPDLQETIWSKKVADYVIKEGGHAVEYLVEQVRRFIKNKEIGILVVDDSSVSRNHLARLLQVHQYKVYLAENGLQGFDILKSNNDIKLVLTDYAMPECDGFELTRMIRQEYPLDRVAIIGISASGSHSMLIKFIKYGANDFMTKPFVSELLFCRISQNLRIIESFEAIRESSFIDHLTQIHNRRHLSETGELIFNTALRNGGYIAVAMADIDDFKQINDSMGHDMGDDVIKQVADIMKKSTRKTDLLVRYGGEEFCILGNNMDPGQAVTIFDSIREKVRQHTFHYAGQSFHVTISIGLCIEKKATLTDMINAADERLYQAKLQGKNRVCL